MIHIKKEDTEEQQQKMQNCLKTLRLLKGKIVVHNPPPFFFNLSFKKNAFMVVVKFNKVLIENSDQLPYSNSILKNLTEFP